MRIDTAISKYTDYRLSLGEKFRVNGYILRDFASHVGQDADLNTITNQQSLDFLYSKAGINTQVTSYWFCIYAAINGLFLWAVPRGYAEKNPLPIDKPKEPVAFEPYIYSKDELRLIFNTALHYRKRFNIFYPEVIQCMLKVTYMLGLRPSETVKFSISDIRLGDDNYALIRETKFYKSRLVTFNNQVALLLSSYMKWRRDHGLSEVGEAPLFQDKKAQPMKLSGFQQAFRLICDKAKIHRPDLETSRSDVRLQDLRHTFATDRVTYWYESGKDVQELLPVLSTYLGHCNLDSTAVYITFTDALLKEASNKFESYNGR